MGSDSLGSIQASEWWLNQTPITLHLQHLVETVGNIVNFLNTPKFHRIREQYWQNSMTDHKILKLLALSSCHITFLWPPLFSRFLTVYGTLPGIYSFYMRTIQLVIVLYEYICYHDNLTIPSPHILSLMHIHSHSPFRPP